MRQSAASDRPLAATSGRGCASDCLEKKNHPVDVIFIRGRDALPIACKKNHPVDVIFIRGRDELSVACRRGTTRLIRVKVRVRVRVITIVNSQYSHIHIDDSHMHNGKIQYRGEW